MGTIQCENLNEYRVYLANEEKSEATIEKYLRDVETFVKWLGDGEPVTKDRIMEYKKWLSGKYMISSANSMLTALNLFFAYMGWNECRIKTFKTQPNHFYDEDKELSRYEYERLIDTARKSGRERLALIIETIGGTGIRISELEYITVEAAKNGKIEVSGKGKHREIYLVGKLRRKLSAYCRRNKISRGAVFVTRNGKAVDRSNIWKELKELGRKAGVNAEKVFPHNLRHFFARTYYKVHKNIGWLADILGHSSINTTRIYTATTGENHVKMLESLGLVL